MASYFDATAPADLQLLPQYMQSDSELAYIASQVEADVISMYTERAPYYLYTARQEYLRNGLVSTETVGEDISAQNAPTGAITPQLRVYLKGYKADASDALVDPNLKTALKRTIAEVIRWRIVQWKREQGLMSSSDSEGTSRSYGPQSSDPFPPNWNRYLKPFESGEAIFGF